MRLRHSVAIKSLAAGTVLVLGMLAVTMGFSGCMSFQMEDSEIAEHFAVREQSVPTFYVHPDAEGEVFVASVGSGPSVVFVHGSPGSWDSFIHMLSDETLRSSYTVSAVDRPGFGRTLPKKAEPSLEVQARRIRDAIEASEVPLPAIWVGHSLGGPVVAKIALESPDSVAGLVLVAPSIDPDLEKRRWYNWMGKFPLVKWSLSRAWRNSNEEIFPLKPELESLKSQLHLVSAPTIVLQGDEDSLVPPDNAEFVKREFSNAVVELRILEGVDHFIPWSHPGLIKQAIRDLQQRNLSDQ